MTQAARSGRQNIAEGSRASATSSQTELRLVNVARASLDELLLDYEDFLRQRSLRQWAKNDQEAQEVRAVSRQWPHPTDPSISGDQPDYALYVRWLGNTDPAIVANAIICLIHQANYLLDHQIAGLERKFVSEGGYSERLATARIEERRKQQPTVDQKQESLPTCPTCGGVMALRTARNGKHAGRQFWGCCSYPVCKGTRAVE
jgi:restriction system protein